MRRRAIILALFAALCATTVSADFIRLGITRGQADALYCAKLGCSISGTLNVTSKALQINSVYFNAFELRIVNTAGTLQHQITSESSSGTASNFAQGVTGASATLANTPSVAAGVNFTSGAGIEAAATQVVQLNTAAETAGDNTLQCVVAVNSTGSNVACQPVLRTTNINGVSQRRVALIFTVVGTGAAFNITTTNIASGKELTVRLSGYF